MNSPVFNKPRSVERPEIVKYWGSSAYVTTYKLEKLTNGRNIAATISSSFSVRAISRPPSRGTMIPARNAPVHHIRSKMGICTRNGGEHTEYSMDPDDVESQTESPRESSKWKD